MVTKKKAPAAFSRPVAPGGANNKKAPRPLLHIFVVLVLDLLGMALMAPLTPYIAASLGAGPFAAGLLTASYSAASFVAAPALGRASDVFGRRSALVVAALGSALSHLYLSFSPPLLGCFAARLCAGCFGVPAIAKAYIVDCVDAGNVPGADAEESADKGGGAEGSPDARPAGDGNRANDSIETGAAAVASRTRSTTAAELRRRGRAEKEDGNEETEEEIDDEDGARGSASRGGESGSRDAGKSKALGIVGAAFGMAFTVGPVIGGMAVQRGGNFEVVGIASAVLSSIAALYAAFVLPAPPAKVRGGDLARCGGSGGTSWAISSARALASRGPLGSMLRFKAASSLGSLLFNTTVILHAKHRLGFGPRETGCLLGYIGVLVGTSHGVLTRILSRAGFHDATIVRTATLLSVPAMLVYAHTWPASAIWLTVLPLCATRVREPSLDALLAGLAPPRGAGWVMGIAASADAAAKVAAAALGGWLIDAWGPTAPGTIGAGFIAAAYLFFLPQGLHALPSSSTKRHS